MAWPASITQQMRSRTLLQQAGQDSGTRLTWVQSPHCHLFTSSVSLRGVHFLAPQDFSVNALSGTLYKRRLTNVSLFLGLRDA